VASGNGPFGYQWFKGETLLSGETNECLSITNVSELKAGQYCVVVSGACNSVTNCATLTLLTNTSAIGPSDAAACPGSSVSLCTVASGSGPFGYQWQKATMPLAGETNNCLILPNVSEADGGD